MALTPEDVKREVYRVMERAKHSSIAQAEVKYAVATLVWANSSKESFGRNLRDTFSEAFNADGLELMIISSDVESLPSPELRVGAYVTVGDVINDVVLRSYRREISEEALKRVIANCREASSLRGLINLNIAFKYLVTLDCREVDRLTGKANSHRLVVKTLLGIYVGRREKKLAIFSFCPEVLKNALSYCFDS